ncbi:MAG: hypothetical protein ACUVRM_11280 [Bacillota bacterium]
MKKVLAVLLGLVLVLGLSSMALAGDEGFSYSGKFTLEWNSSGFDAPAADYKNFVKGVYTVELKKSEGDVTAGVKASIDPFFTVTSEAAVSEYGLLKDFSGYITINNLLDTFNLTASTSADLGAGTIKGAGSLNGAPGLKVQLLPDLVEGLSATFVINDQAHDPNTNAAQADYGYGISGEFTLEGLGKVGGAYTVDADTAYAFWGSLTAMEGVTLKGEYDSKADGAGTAYFVEVAASGLVEGLNVTAGYEGKNEGWGIMDMEDEYGVHGYYRNSGVAESNVYAEATFGPIADLVTLKAGVGYVLNAKKYAVYVGASAPVAEGLTVDGTFNYNSDGWKVSGSVTQVIDKATLKVSADYSKDGSYTVKPEASYNFGAGVTGNAFVQLDKSGTSYGASLSVSF